MHDDGRTSRPTRGRTGTDVPVLLLTGTGMAAATRLRTLPVIAEPFRVITMHAGAAQGDRGHVIAGLAEEAMALLDAGGVTRAHVYGLSFGGMVAQELALAFPDRVQSLVLGATSGGGRLRVAPDDDAREFIRRRSDMPMLEGLWAAVPYSYALATRRRRARRIGEDIAERLEAPPDPEHHRTQREAALRHDAADRLGALSVPTLVIHGEEDRLVPPENGQRLARTIPGAELRTFPDAAHLYPTDEPEADREAVAFMLRHGPPVRRPPRSGSGRAARA
jgi:pimeloyl-ACP methyl ester carboxylesterase